MSDKSQIVDTTTITQPEYTIQDLAPNNYLTIVWHNSKGEQITSLDIDNEKYAEYLDSLMSALNTAISENKVNYIGQNKYVNLESIAKYLAQNIFKTSPQRTVVNALIGLISKGGKGIDDSSINLIINMFGGITNKVARYFGFSDPHEIFASFMSENTISVLKVWGDKTQEYIDSVKEKFHKNKENVTPSVKTTEQKTNESNEIITSKQYAGLLLGLTTSDTESYDISIAKKKVEYGSDYTTHILPQQFKKDFTVKLTNKVWTSNFDRIKEINEIERVKDKLIEIAQSRIPFDIYIRLSNDKMYKRRNVYFTSLSFSKDENSGDSYECTFSIEPIIEFKTKTFISDRKYFPTASKNGTDGNGSVSRIGGTRGSGSSSSRGSVKTSKTTSKGNNLSLGFADGGKGGVSKLGGDKFKSKAQILDVVRQGNIRNGTDYMTIEYLEQGGNHPDFYAKTASNFVLTSRGYYAPKDLCKRIGKEWELNPKKAFYSNGAIYNGKEVFKVHNTRPTYIKYAGPVIKSRI